MGGKTEIKNYFYNALSDEEEEDTMHLSKIQPTRKRQTKSIDEFFEEIQNKKKKAKVSSTVGQAVNGGVAYVSTNEDDLANASHLVKIEVYEQKKLKKIPPTDHWKHANVRVKYYVKNCENDSKYHTIKDIIYNITKEIVDHAECKKYFFSNDKQ